MKKLRLLGAAALVIVIAAVALVAAIGAEWGLSPTNLALIASSIRLVQRNYIHPISQDQLITDALKGMFTRLDPHSDYMDEQEFKEAKGTINGKFGGLGIEMSDQRGTPQVISPIDGEPAACRETRSPHQRRAPDLYRLDGCPSGFATPAFSLAGGLRRDRGTSLCR